MALSATGDTIMQIPVSLPSACNLSTKYLSMYYV